MKKIALSRGKFAIVDDEDFEIHSDKQWYCMKAGYAARSAVIDGKKVCFYLHREILGAPKHKKVDHINGDTLDNRRANLRLCAHQQNMQNKKQYRSNTSGYKGVCFDKQTGKWKAHININGKLKHLGRFETAELASECYELAAEQVFGEFKRME